MVLIQKSFTSPCGCLERGEIGSAFEATVKAESGPTRDKVARTKKNRRLFRACGSKMLWSPFATQERSMAIET
jgi:hypothetical protein